MSTSDTATPPDPAAIAAKTAKNFYDGATNIRESALGQPTDEADRLNAKADELEECGDSYTADAIANVLGTIAPDLQKIQAVTTEANAQIKTLTDIDMIITDATLMLAVGTSALTGDPAAIIAAVQALADQLAADATSSSS